MAGLIGNLGDSLYAYEDSSRNRAQANEEHTRFMAGREAFDQELRFKEVALKEQADWMTFQEDPDNRRDMALVEEGDPAAMSRLLQKKGFNAELSEDGNNVLLDGQVFSQVNDQYAFQKAWTMLAPASVQREQNRKDLDRREGNEDWLARQTAAAGLSMSNRGAGGGTSTKAPSSFLDTTDEVREEIDKTGTSYILTRMGYTANKNGNWVDAKGRAASPEAVSYARETAHQVHMNVGGTNNKVPDQYYNNMKSGIDQIDLNAGFNAQYPEAAARIVEASKRPGITDGAVATYTDETTGQEHTVYDVGQMGVNLWNRVFN